MEEVETNKMLDWYNELQVGQERGPLELCITAESNENWLGFTQDPTP